MQNPDSLIINLYLNYYSTRLERKIAREILNDLTIATTRSNSEVK